MRLLNLANEFIAALVAIYGTDGSGWCGISGSSAGAVIACPSRLAYPQANKTGTYAVRGNELHEFARKITVNPDCREQALLDIDDEKTRATAMGMDVALALDGIEKPECEPAFVLNVKERKTRFLGHNIGRQYAKVAAELGCPLTRYDVPFSIDVLGTVMGNVPCELDYKSGRSIGKPEEHWQRRVCTAGLMYYFDTASAVGRVAYIWEDGSIHPDGHEFTVMDADGYCDELVAAIDKVWEMRAQYAQQIQPPVNADRDEQCKYCNSFSFCPYWNALAKTIANEEAPDIRGLSAEERGRVFDKVKDVLKVYGKLEEDLKEHALREPLPISEKQEFRAEWSDGRAYFDQSGARGLLITMMGRAGLSEDEIAEKMASLNKKGKSFPTVTKRKRELPVVQEARKAS